MPEQVGVRLRALPDGEFRDASQVGWNGRLLELDVQGASFPLGTLLEIERGPIVFLGELQQLTGSIAIVAVEHSVDRESLRQMQPTWEIT